jgi:hypothetical protein
MIFGVNWYPDPARKILAPTVQKFQISDPYLGTHPSLGPRDETNVMIICEKQCFVSGVDPNSVRFSDPDQKGNTDADPGRQK